jgi:acetone carboxylase gamma subunit
MTDAILQAYKDVEQAVERYTKLLQDHVATLQNIEPPSSDKVIRMTQGSKAMRDSAMIYLSYAKYVAYGMPASEEMVEDEIQE